MGAAGLTAVGARGAAGSALSYPEGAPGTKYRFTSLEQALGEVRALCAAGELRTTGSWSWTQILIHNAQGIEFSLAGYPENKPELVRRTVGRLVHARFVEQGYMKHDLAAAIPGAPSLQVSGISQEGALARLERAAVAFQRHSSSLAPHFVYGALSKNEFDRVHAMHLANHLSEVIAPS